MSLDLLNELEKRVQSAVDTIETLKLEIEELKEDNAQLQDDNAQLQEEKTAWESRLGDLLGKFDLLEDEEASAEAVEEVIEDEVAAPVASEGELMDQGSAEEALIEQDSALDELDDLTEEEEAELEAQTAPSQFGNL